MKTYQCPYCEKKLIRDKLVSHIEKYHDEEVPDNYTPYRLVYDIVNDKQGHGNCTICGKPTKWNEKRQKYERLCGNPKCYEAVKKTYQKRMMRVYNKVSLMDDPHHLENMLAHRKISGKYKWSDGKVFTYTGKYEKNLMEFLDKTLEFKSNEVIAPGPILEYEFQGKKHKWITDFLILPYNLIIEVKDGGDNPNNRFMPVYRAKQAYKEKMITSLGIYSYLRLTNNDFGQLLGILTELKMKTLDDTDKTPLYRIHEDTTDPSSSSSVIYYNSEGDDDTMINEETHIPIIFSNDDVKYRVDEWQQGKLNILYVIGLSGAGKSTLTEKWSKEYHCDLVHMDYVHWFINQGLFSLHGQLNTRILNGVPYLREWFKDSYNQNIEDYEAPGKNLTTEKKYDYFYSYILWIIKHNKRIIVDGMQILEMINMPKYSNSIYDNAAFYVVGTSMMTSNFRRLKRFIQRGDYKEVGWKYYLKTIKDTYNRRDWLNDNLDKVIKEDIDVLNEEVQSFTSVSTYSNINGKENSTKEVFNSLSDKEKEYVSPHEERIANYHAPVVMTKTEKVNGKDAGYIQLKKSKDNTTLFVTIAVSPQYRGKGLSEKLIKAAKDYFKNSDQKMLLWRCDADNIASRKTAEKNGFKLHHKTNEQYTYCIEKSSVNEAVTDMPIFISDKDVEYNVDKWKDGKIKLLFVTGMSGGGKSTLSHQLATQYHATHIQMDHVYHYLNGNLRDAKPPMIDEWFLIAHGYPRNEAPTPDNIPKQLGKDSTDYITWVVKKLKGQIVIEGLGVVTLFDYNKDLFDGAAVIIKGTSLFTSFFRRVIRDRRDYHQNAFTIDTIRNYKKWLKYQNKFRADISQYMLREYAEYYDALHNK